MNNLLTTYEGLSAISSMKARVQAVEWSEIMREIAAAPKNQIVLTMKRIAESRGIPYATIRNKRSAYEREGDAALIDRRRVKQMTAVNPWLSAFLAYCENDLNTSRGGYRQMMIDFRSGKRMLGSIGTWIDVWRREKPGVPIPKECPLDWTPKGASYANLMAIAKANPDYYFSIAMTRRGRKEAGRYLIPVLKTRVGLAVGAMVEYDDVWHNIDVIMRSGRKIAQPMEFAGYDVASGYKCSSIIKPRFEREGGVRDNLKEQQFRFLFAYDHIVRGFHRDGIDDIVEHGTTAIRANVEKQIKSIPGWGNLIRIHRSGILSEQAHAGLFIGNGGGNFKMKALCEGSHNIMHNRTASLLGNHGRDAAHKQESQAALIRYEERLLAAFEALPEEFAVKLEAGLLTFEDYLAAFRLIEDRLMDDPEHRLEGWSGNVVAEYRDSPTSNEWRSFREVEELAKGDETDRTEAFLIARKLARDPQLKRIRPMSRREVWLAGQADFVRVEDWYLPSFMDIAKDAIELRVRDNGLMGFRNELLYGPDEMLYRATVVTRKGQRQELAPGRKVFALYNPLMPEKIWIVDGADGRTLGTCPIYERAPAYDRHAIERAMGDQAADLSKKLLPIRGRHQAEAEARAERMANNLRVIKAAHGVATATTTEPGDAGRLTDEDASDFEILSR